MAKSYTTVPKSSASNAPVYGNTSGGTSGGGATAAAVSKAMRQPQTQATPAPTATSSVLSPTNQNNPLRNGFKSVDDVLKNSKQITDFLNSLPDSEIAKNKTAQGIIGKAMGYDAKPKLVNKLTPLKGDVVIYRGVDGNNLQGADETSTAVSRVQDFKTGAMFQGVGIFGDGSYFSTDRDTALRYAQNISQGVMKATLNIKKSKIIDYDNLKQLHNKLNNASSINNEFKDLLRESKIKGKEMGEKAIGAVATLLGYDAIRVNRGSEYYYVVLNRGALTVEK